MPRSMGGLRLLRRKVARPRDRAARSVTRLRRSTTSGGDPDVQRSYRSGIEQPVEDEQHVARRGVREAGSGICVLGGLQPFLDLLDRQVGGQDARPLREEQLGSPQPGVEPLVAEDDAVLIADVGQPLAALLADHAADLEDVREVGVDAQRERQRSGCMV